MFDKNERLAEEFLRVHDLVLHAEYAGLGCPGWCRGDHIHGPRYVVSLTRKCDENDLLYFDFWTSYHDHKYDRRPSNHQILTIIAERWPFPDTINGVIGQVGELFEELGLNMEHALNVLDFHRKVLKFFDAKEIDALGRFHRHLKRT